MLYYFKMGVNNLIIKMFDTLKTAERERNKLDQEFEILREKNAKRSAVIKKDIDSKSKEFTTRKRQRSKDFDIIRNK